MSKQNDMSEKIEIYDWLLIFFLHETPMFEYFPKNILREIKEVGTNNSNLVIIVHDTFDGKNFRTEVNQLKIKSGESNQFEYHLLKLDLNFDFHSGRCWEVMLKFIFTKIKSKRRIIMTFSHGMAFGIGDGTYRNSKLQLVSGSNIEENSSSELSHKNFINKRVQKHDEKPTHGYNNYLTGIDLGEIECKDINLLWVSELCEALKNSISNQKIDILLLINCNMLVFDCSWLLRKYVKYLVACESIVSAAGFSHKSLLKTINESPDVSPKELASKITLHHDDNLAIRYPKESEWFDRTAFFVSDLKYYGILKKIFDLVISQLDWKREENITALIDMRKTKFRTVSMVQIDDQIGFQIAKRFQLIDLKCLLTEISVLTVYQSNKLIKAAVKIFSYYLKKSILKSHIGKLLFDEMPNGKRRNHYGTAIYFPIDPEFTKRHDIGKCAYFQNKKYNPFLQKSKWDSFIKYYLEKEPIYKSQINNDKN